MRSSAACYQLEQTIATRLSTLSPAQARGLAWWVQGTILAGSACQNAVTTALATSGREWHAVRQSLREWLYDGTDKASPCAAQVEVTDCFGPLLRWVLALWRDRSLALALDVTSRGEDLTSIVVSVLYRGTALPVGWVVLKGQTEEAWMPHILKLLRTLRPAIPPQVQVLLLADRGLWSPRLWKRIKDLGWHPLLRLQGSIRFTPQGQHRQPARQLVPGPGHAWVGQGVAFTGGRKRAGTLIVVWAPDQQDPWLVFTDLRPRSVGIAWYGLRMWIELGFKALKGLAWHWNKTRRTEPGRVARHWLVVAVTAVWVLATATRIEDATLLDLPPAVLHQPPRQPRWRPAGRARLVSLVSLGMAELRAQILRGRLWRSLWLRPEPWPEPPPGIQITYHDST
jgi:hypothetical protein